MVTCPKCQIDYPEGKKFCRECGGPLLPKGDPPTTKKALMGEGSGATAPTKKEDQTPALFCSACDLDYPLGKKFCKNCGGPLSPRGSSTAKAASQVSPSAPAAPKPPAPTAIEEPVGGRKYCPSCGQEYLPDKGFCKGCGVALVTQPTQSSPLRPRPMAPNAHRPGSSPPGDGSKRPLWFILLMIANGLALVLIFSFAGFFGYRYFYKKENIFTTAPAPAPAAPSGPAITGSPFSPGPPPPPLPPGVASPADEGIRRVFDTIKQANLSENIDLFMSCYSPAFPGYQEKRNSTLQTWQEYDMTKLDYTLSNITINQNRAEVTVNWQISAFSPGSGQTENFNSTHAVTLLNEGGQWKIINLR